MVTTKAPLFSFLLFFSSLLFVSDAEPIVVSDPQTFESFDVSYIQKPGSCRYTVVIRTNCSSPTVTRDRISLAFGDAYGNQIYVPRLDNEFTKRFEKCSLDIFRIKGPCASQIHYLYLHRNGQDGWLPESVKIYGDDADAAVTFKYNTHVPPNVWYGFSRYHDWAPSPSYPPSPTPPPPPVPFVTPPSPPPPPHFPPHSPPPPPHSPLPPAPSPHFPPHSPPPPPPSPLPPAPSPHFPPPSPPPPPHFPPQSPPTQPHSPPPPPPSPPPPPPPHSPPPPSPSPPPPPQSPPPPPPSPPPSPPSSSHRQAISLGWLVLAVVGFSITATLV